MAVGKRGEIRSGIKARGEKGCSRYGFGEWKVVVDVQVIVRLFRVAELDKSTSQHVNGSREGDRGSSNIETTHFILLSPY